MTPATSAAIATTTIPIGFAVRAAFRSHCTAVHAMVAPLTMPETAACRKLPSVNATCAAAADPVAAAQRPVTAAHAPCAAAEMLPAAVEAMVAAVDAVCATLAAARLPTYRSVPM